MLKAYEAPGADTAEISEIFSSLQGEGLFVGEKHLFVRFRSCNIACGYCDEYDKVEFDRYSLASLLGEIKQWDEEAGPHEYISLTGGEPLFYVSFLKGLMPLLAKEGFRLYLETNGTLPKALAQVLPYCDMIAMDIKLPSVTGERSFFAEHEEFLALAAQRNVFVKLVVSTGLSMPEFLTAVHLIAKIGRTISLVLQPMTDPVRGGIEPGIGPFLTSLVSLARRQLSDVRAIPQMHKLLAIK